MENNPLKIEGAGGVDVPLGTFLGVPGMAQF